jgi:nicotinamide-nucleotide adenylyltransferase
MGFLRVLAHLSSGGSWKGRGSSSSTVGSPRLSSGILRGSWLRTGLYIGRFQPFHLGHLEAVKHILREVDELIIVVGSAQNSHTVENPFTAGERITMVRMALKDANIEPSRYLLTPLPDAEFHTVWVAHLLAQTPVFQVAFTNEPLTARLLKEAAVQVEGIPFFKRESYTATEVRRRMLHSEDWESLLPRVVADYLKKIGSVERIREISLSDKPPTSERSSNYLPL